MYDSGNRPTRRDTLNVQLFDRKVTENRLTRENKKRDEIPNRRNGDDERNSSAKAVSFFSIIFFVHYIRFDRTKKARLSKRPRRIRLIT